MGSPPLQPSDPSLLLLDKIEILLAQARLVALYLRQAHATAEAEVTQVQERFQTELARLRADEGDKICTLAEREDVLQNAQAEIAALKKRPSQIDAAEMGKHLSPRITERELQLAEEHLLVEGRDREIARLKAGVSEEVKLDRQTS